MIALLIGPSCVGKSTLARLARDTFHNCAYFDLDQLAIDKTGMASASEVYARYTKDCYWQLFREIVEERKTDCGSAANLCLFDVGAGGLQSEGVKVWLASETTISMIDSPERIYARYANRDQQTFDNFKTLEFQPWQQQAYHEADHHLDMNGMELMEAKSLFIKQLENWYPQLRKRTTA